jgi:hypothetical protein
MKTKKLYERDIEVFSILSFSVSAVAFVASFTFRNAYVDFLFLPGILFGHISRHRLKRNPVLGGSMIALMGITAGYAIPVIFIIQQYIK